MKRGTRIGLYRLAGIAALVIVVALLIVFRLATYTPPEKLSVVSSSEAAHAEVAVNAVEDEWSDVSRAAASGKRTPFKVSIRQEDVTNFLRSDEGASRLMSGRHIRQPQVRFDSRRVTSSAYVTYHRKKLFITVTGSLSRGPGKLVFHTDLVRIGKLPAPSAIAKRVDEAINAYLCFGKALPAEITDIKTDGGQFVMSGVSDPEILHR